MVCQHLGSIWIANGTHPDIHKVLIRKTSVKKDQHSPSDHKTTELRRVGKIRKMRQTTKQTHLSHAWYEKQAI